MGDVFRSEYRELSDEEKEAVANVKNVAETLYEQFDKATNDGNGRELAVAKTNLEQAVMWAVKGMTK